MPQGPSDNQGVLYVVATPIGNLADMSPRAIDTLKSVNAVLAEDTRSYRRLANEFGFETPCVSYHDHNEISRTKDVIERLLAGEQLALVSDAGTPAISDPGYRLIRACREAQIPVRTIPGASSIIAALSISGFELNEFTYLGFLPMKPGKKQKALEQALEEERTFVFFESPHRLLKTLGLLHQLAPEREIGVFRELTKRFEESLFGSAKDLIAEFEKRNSDVRGEIVVVVRGATK